MKLINKILFLLPLALLVNTPAFAQPVNDECNNAIIINEVQNWCSDVAAFTSVDATESPEPLPGCFPQQPQSHDVWFAFVAEANFVSISVNGNTAGSPGGNLQNPQVALYSGNCGAGLVELECLSDAFNNNTVETLGGPLTLGETYFIRVDARNANSGTFQLCINNYFQVPEPSSDCSDGVVLCDKSPFTVQSVSGAGSDPNEIDVSSCLGPESSSVWYKWTCDQSGSLTFTLTPNQASDDLDFAVYELPNGVDNCNGKEMLRCMASGENVGEPLSTWQACTGSTGLSSSDTDTEEQPGCQAGNNNFVSAVNMVSGRSYALVVNNFSNTGSGFSITWGGSGTFLGPLADFEITPFEDVPCEEEVIILDASSFDAGNIVGWDWNFGAGAMPPTANTQGPHPVTYNSVGDKSVVLTVETDAGCIVTKVLDLEIISCCSLENLAISLDDTEDPNCNGESSGSIAVSATGGTPLYSYSLDGENYISISNFNSLEAGDYTIYVQDIKGCLDSIDASLLDPPPLFVDAGEDVTIELGNFTDLEAIVSPAQLVDYSWVPDSLVVCSTCAATDTDTLPNTTTFTMTVTDMDGCTASDEVTVFVIKNRPIYIPNAFSPNGDGTNDNFTVYGGPGARRIETLRVFNRWGALVFEARDIPLGENAFGWDGTFKGQRMTPDVFAYYAVVEFIDGELVLFEGDITIVK